MLAAVIAQEGCIGDTVRCAVVAVAVQNTSDPAVKAALGVVLANELHHVSLTWRILKWALARGDADRTHGALEDVFDDGLAFSVRCSEVSRDLSLFGFLGNDAAEKVPHTLLR